MLFNSLVFLLIYLPVCLGLYFLAPKQFKNHVLLILSLIFYAWGEPIYVLLMVFSIVFNYAMAFPIGMLRKRGAKAVLAAAIVVNLGLLGCFKYLDFLIVNLNSVLGFSFTEQHLSLPIGISFYTFQILSYIIDVYRGKVAVQKNFSHLAMYITLFPQLVAGPIVRYSEIAEQLESRKIHFAGFVEGFRRFICGLGKKTLIANQMAVIADTIYGQPLDRVGTGILWLAAIAYTFQIYFDFSGYSDMAIGLGKMFGFDFPENFNYPYMATSMTGFWRRWHMSMSFWFRDYVYFPLGGNKVGPQRLMGNLFIVWFLTGLWHGAAWNFVLWGLYNGFILVQEKLLFRRFLACLPNLLRRCYLMFCVIIGWVLFRLPDVEMMKAALSGMFHFTSMDLDWLVSEFSLVAALPWLSVAFLGCFPVFGNLLKRAAHGKIFAGRRWESGSRTTAHQGGDTHDFFGGRRVNGSAAAEHGKMKQHTSAEGKQTGNSVLSEQRQLNGSAAAGQSPVKDGASFGRRVKHCAGFAKYEVVVNVLLNLFYLAVFYFSIATLLAATYNPFIYFRF